MNPSRLQRILLGVSLCLWCVMAGAQTAEPPVDPIYEGKLGALVDSVELPLLAETWTAVTAEMRASMAGIFLGGVAKGAKLDERWRPGNLHYDRALRLVEKSLVAEEARAGPLFAWSRDAFLRSFRPPWTSDEIDYLTDVSRTETGKVVAEFYDAAAVPMLIDGLGEAPFKTDALRRRLDELRGVARDRFGAVAPRFSDLKGRDAAIVGRVLDLIKRMDTEKTGYETVRRMYLEPTRRLSRAVFDVMSDLHAEIAAFKRSLGELPDDAGRT